MQSRRSFLKNTTWLATLPTLSLSACTNTKMENRIPELKISLAQWSLHKAIKGGELNAVDFANVAINDFGIKAVEYVNQFYSEYAEDEKFWNGMKVRADNAGVKKPFNYGRCGRRFWEMRMRRPEKQQWKIILNGYMRQK